MGYVITIQICQTHRTQQSGTVSQSHTSNLSDSLHFPLPFLPLPFTTVFPNEISPMVNSGCRSRGKPAATESRYPTYGACWVLQCFHNPPNSDMVYGIFNARTDVNACDCAGRCTDIVRESALKVDSERKIPYRTGKSNLGQRRADPTLCQLSYLLFCA